MFLCYQLRMVLKLENSVGEKESAAKFSAMFGKGLQCR